MNESTAKFAVHLIGERIGIAVDYRIRRDRDGDYCEITPLDFHPNEGLMVQFRLGWRSAEAVFIPGPYSAQLISRMGTCSLESKLTFGAFATAVISKDVKVLMRVNGFDINPLEPATWPSKWSKLELVLKQSPFVVEEENEAQHERLVIDLAIPLFGMVVSLIGAEENALSTTGELEGGAVQAVVTRYERSRLNREACIQLKGTRCEVCGFDFADAYGPLGLGYIEIHHLKPIATIGADYCINVSSDLAPVCANCHAMAHREQPPVPLDRLRTLVEERRRVK